MKLRISSLGTTCLLLSPLAFAMPPVTLSGPTPAIPTLFSPILTRTFTYTVNNYVPQWLPLSIGGISSPIQRVSVPNDCGYGLLAGSPSNPSTCQIGISLTTTMANANTSINQNLLVNYGGRTTKEISFKIHASHSI